MAVLRILMTPWHILEIWRPLKDSNSYLTHFGLRVCRNTFRLNYGWL